MITFLLYMLWLLLWAVVIVGITFLGWAIVV